MTYRLFLLLVLGTALSGCTPPGSGTPASGGQSVSDQTATTSSPGAGGSPSGQSNGNGGGVQVVTGGAGAGGATPVVGGESLQGGGSGVGQAAVDAAHKAAAKESSGTAGSTSPSDN